jgi:PrcB C-terminal
VLVGVLRPWSHSGTRGLVALGLAICLLAAGWDVVRSAGVRDRSVQWTQLRVRGGPFEFATVEEQRFLKQHDLARYFRSHLVGRTLRVPSVDFSRFVVEMFTVGPRSSAGYSLSVRRVYERAGRIVVTVDEHAPALGSIAQAKVTFPFVLVRLPRGEPVVVDWRQHP